jgi:hypothetical protein
MWGGYGARCSCNDAGNTVCQLNDVPFAAAKASECATQLRAMGACLNTNQCVYQLTPFEDAGSCAQTKCKNEINCALTCAGIPDAFAAAGAARKASGCNVPSFNVECQGSGAALFVGFVALLALLF